MKALKRIILVCVFLSCPAGRGFAESTARTDYRLDPELFRRGMIDRGFDDWLKLYDREHPPVSDLDLLAQQIGQAWLAYRRAPEESRREQALDHLLALELDRVESYPDHPLSANWRVRYAADLLNERFGGWAFLHLLDLEVPAEGRKQFQSGLDRIDAQLDQARKFLQDQLEQFERFDDAQLTGVNRQGLPELYRAALLQADYLWAWAQFHRAKLTASGSSAQVAILYRLSDQLDKLAGSDTDSGGEKLLQGAVSRLLGKLPQAQAALTQAGKSLSSNHLLFADLEQANLALAENQPTRGLEIVLAAKKREGYPDDASRRALADLALDLQETRIRLKMLAKADRTDVALRNQIWKVVTARLMESPRLCELAWSKIRAEAESIPPSSQADLELYARAKWELGVQKAPLAQTLLTELLGRKGVVPGLYRMAALLSARVREQQGRFAEAARVLQTAAEAPTTQPTAELLAESARLSWLAYRAAPTDRQRSVFIDAAKRLLTRFPQSPSADQFKLLMAEEMSRSGDFFQARQWIDQVPPGSPLYLQSRAARVLILSRQCQRVIQSGGPATATRPGTATEELEEACRELITIASARQKQPEKVETWNLDAEQVQLVAGALLATAGVLSDPAVGRAPVADALLARYRPILDRYEKTSKSAVLARIATLAQGATPDGLLEAVALVKGVIDTHELPVAQIVTATVGVLQSVHQFVLTRQADPQGSGDGLSPSALEVARRARDKFSSARGLEADLRDRLGVLCLVTAVDAGQYALAGKWLPERSDGDEAPDLTLARARIKLFEKNYADAVILSGGGLTRLSPADIRYWHLLVVNLQAHLALGSDREQVAAAVIARQLEYPELGNPAVKSELLNILRTAKGEEKAGEAQAPKK